MKTIPGDPAAASQAFPWIDYEGRWGELQPAFFNGPTGPNAKKQWTEPLTWSEGWRDVSYAVPTGGLFGTSATDTFCSGVAKGSRALILLLRNPTAVFLVLAVLIGLLAFVVKRATWSPSTPLHLARRRSWGQILSASAHMYVTRPRVFIGIGLLLLPIMLVTAILQWIALEGLRAVEIVTTGESAGSSAILALVIGTALAFIGLGLVQAAATYALMEADEGRALTARRAYRAVWEHRRPLLGAVAVFVLAWVALTAFPPLIPVAAFLAVRWCLVAPVVAVERRGGLAALRRSGRLVSGRWFRTGSLVGLSAAIALVSGPLLGALMIFVVSLPLATINVVAGVVYAVALPFVGLVTAYAYFDARARLELEPAERPAELPAEISLERGR